MLCREEAQDSQKTLPKVNSGQIGLTPTNLTTVGRRSRGAIPFSKNHLPGQLQNVKEHGAGRLNGTTLPPLDGNSSGYIQQDAIYFPPNQGNRTTDGADRTDWEPTGKRPLHPCHPEIRGKIPATPPSLMVAPPTSPIACKRTAEMILTKSALSAMLFQDFAMEPIGSMAVKTTRKPCVAIQERPRRGGGQNKPGQRGSGRACLRNAFIKGVSAWRIGNQFALSNFVLIPIKTREI
jgi:hypothetical protein